jgi:putative endonuclease
MITKKINTGKEGENLAVNYLIKKNYIIEAVNWRYRRAEVDIIANDGNFLVFCEVKTRTNIAFGDPAEFVNQKKIKLLSDAAAAYMIEKDYQGEFRFDIVAIFMKNTQEYSIAHYEDAFFPGLSQDY